MPLTVLNVAYPFAPVGPDAVGGAEQVLAAIDDALVRAGQRSLVLACEGSRVRGQLFPFAIPEGVLTPELRAEAKLRYRALLETILCSERVDVVHLHGVDFHAYEPRSSVPCLVTLHLPLAWYPPQVFVPRPHVHLHCVSASQRALCPEGAVLRDDIPNGIDLSRFHVAARREPHAVVLSRICPEKGIHLALAAAKLAGVRLHLHGRVFPYAEHQRYFDEEVAPLLDDERVFLGPIGMPEKARALSRARCVVIPSLAPETSSLVAMEALASGTPVVATPRGALPDLITHGETGFLADTIEGLAAGIDASRSLESLACRAEAERRFSLETSSDRYLQAYESLARARPRPTSGSVVQVDELRSDEALAAIEGEWGALRDRCRGATVFQSHAWIRAWSAHLRSGELVVLLIRRAARLVGVAPFFVWTDAEGARVLSLAGAGVSDYQDVLFEDGLEHDCLRALERWLAGSRERWDRIEWSELRAESPLLRARVRRDGHWRSDVTEQDECASLLLEGSPARVLERVVPAGMLRRVRYARRRADREGGWTIELADEESLPALFGALARLHSARRHARNERAPLEDPQTLAFHRSASASLAANGELLLFGVRIGGELAAVLHALHDRGTTRYYQSGFEPSLASRSPGVLAIAHAIELARARGATSFDFLRGREGYKDEWGARAACRLHRLVIAPRESRRLAPREALVAPALRL
jgi:glycosyltransferase involved in cell wall biosynthesis/CelD/BcsL family acetyltransferase involved in cellulose biosynthesis